MSIESVTGLVGGVGLFLVGMWLMTEGLKVAAGPSLKALLERWTNTRLRGLVSGFAVTALVQSSSAVTVATIGFVNAGVLTLRQAVWVIFGSNVGTTMTGWMVAIIGFNVNIEFLALPLVGVGMMVRLTSPGSARGALGEALTGFGLFFLGVAVLKDSFGGIAAGLSVDALSDGFMQDFLFVLAGFFITALAQSSSASIAIALSAVSSGLIGLETGAAMVIGANLGTTVTGLLAVLNATSNAKRVAASHLIFNLATGAIAFLILPGFVAIISWLAVTELALGAAAVLALFHTLFNVLGVVLFWGLTDRLIAKLETLFVSEDENEARARYLDQTLRDVPSLAVPSLLLELQRLEAIVAEAGASYLRDPAGKAAYLRQRFLVASRLAETIREYAADLSEARLPTGLPDALAHALRALQHCNGTVHELEALMTYTATEARMPDSARRALADYRQAVAAFLADPQNYAAHTDVEWLTAAGNRFEGQYQEIKQVVLSAASRGDFVYLAYLDDAMREADLMRRIAHHAVRGAMRLQAAQDIIASPPGKTQPEAPEAVQSNE
ncbi:Na+/Picotransporter [Parvibaculum lavamentivorans DS-1]|uniref:Na+/Picotransporter n=1 Tax=Parvibaculum lavamentivorans (strain DS-1 / DSM 13023 / NCIMB 13966) TaxID=402881 RepID=A7HX33_PARL1|nr:Na/Pi symporter [Parvibaculum lavamentivorans]ABS64466.1 Na+/Picotransporter [Parvibaculum lavamentivorans DS-1]